jgi:hypothetical protein
MSFQLKSLGSRIFKQENFPIFIIQLKLSFDEMRKNENLATTALTKLDYWEKGIIKHYVSFIGHYYSNADAKVTASS